MPTIAQQGLLFNDPDAAPFPAAPPAAVKDELVRLAAEEGGRAERSRRLFRLLRKAAGAPRGEELLQGVLHAAAEGGAVGARLLASFLDTCTRDERLVPPLQTLSSARRLNFLQTEDSRSANSFSRSWQERKQRLIGELIPAGNDAPGLEQRPGWESPWGEMRRALADSLEVLRGAAPPDERSLDLVRDLLRLEVDALEERASRLAGLVNPYRVSAVQRLLPVLGRLDPGIRDTREFVAEIEPDRLDELFHQQQSRALEALEAGEYAALLEKMRGSGPVAGLMRLHEARTCKQCTTVQLAAGIDTLRRCGEWFAARGIPNTASRLLTATALAVRCAEREGLVVPLNTDEAKGVADLLADPQAQELAARVRLTEAGLVVAWPQDICAPSLPHGFPAFSDRSLEDEMGGAAEPDASTDAKEFDASHVKKLVMESMQTTSVLLSFLSNQKVTSIPGLVAEVATRTRNPQIISTIAGDRTLHSGFANRDVPLACLRNPSNISVKVLRKFVHVKFVSKIDLKRMAVDKAGVRRELRQEIERYLASLA